MKRQRRILVVEDDAKTSQMVALYLRHAGYDVQQSYDGDAAMNSFAESEPDLVVLDLMLPKTPGAEVCARIRGVSEVPIIMLTARTTEADRLRGLDSGADDYVTKPFSPRELVARVKAVMRRRLQTVRENFFCGDLELNLGAREARIRDGAALDLTPTEFGLLHALVRNAGVARRREELIAEVMGHDYEGSERAIDVHVRNLRRKLSDAGAKRTRISALFGYGYKIETDE